MGLFELLKEKNSITTGKKTFTFVFGIIFALFLTACGENTEALVGSGTSIEQTPAIEDNEQLGNVSSEQVTKPIELVYFEPDEAVDKFFSDYNGIAEVVIPIDKIRKGNIRTKALVYVDDLSLEIINDNDFLSVSMSSSAENENAQLYAIFRDAIRAMDSRFVENDILGVWNEIHKSGYFVEDYDFNGIKISYVPSKELSWGVSSSRIDLIFPLE